MIRSFEIVYGVPGFFEGFRHLRDSVVRGAAAGPVEGERLCQFFEYARLQVVVDKDSFDFGDQPHRLVFSLEKGVHQFEEPGLMAYGTCTSFGITTFITWFGAWGSR